jgi:hypothetical protein
MDLEANTSDEQHDRRQQQDEALIELLAAGANYANAGQAVGVSARTVRRRMTDEAFATRVAERRGELLAVVTGQALSRSERALEVLFEIADSAKDPKYRVSAALGLISASLRLRRETDLAHEIASLKRAMEAIKAEKIGSGIKEDEDGDT